MLLKRVDAIATSPSQCPDARDWLTIRAHAEASAVSVQGVATPPTQISSPDPNMETRSVSLKSVSGKAEAGKLGNDHPSIVVCSCVATGPLGALDPPEPPDPPHAERAIMTTKNLVRRLRRLDISSPFPSK